MKTGLVLSGGGARAFMHLGVIQALEEWEIKIDYICGTSAGSVVGAMYGQGYSPIESLEILSKPELYRSIRFAFGGNGFLRMARVENFLSKYFPENDFSVLKPNLTITATDVIAAETVIFESGNVIQPMLASCGLPGIFEPYKYVNRELVDGGVLNNMPVEYLLNKADFIIGAHCNPFLLNRPLRSSFEVAYRSLLIAMHHQNLSRLQQCDLIIEPPEMCNFSIFDFTKAKAIFDVGYAFTKQVLQKQNGLPV